MAQIQTYNSIIEQICAMANNRSNRSSIMNGAGNGSTSINSGDRERGSERNDWQADP